MAKGSAEDAGEDREVVREALGALAAERLRLRQQHDGPSRPLQAIALPRGLILSEFCQNFVRILSKFRQFLAKFP